jgi:hypothetical protein
MGGERDDSSCQAVAAIFFFSPALPAGIQTTTGRKKHFFFCHLQSCRQNSGKIKDPVKFPLQNFSSHHQQTDCASVDNSPQ